MYETYEVIASYFKQIRKIYFENFAPENAIEKLLNLQYSLYAAKRRKQVEFVANV